MKVEISNKNLIQNKQSKPNFAGPIDGALTQGLIAIDTNPMVNATLIDIFSMVIPRTYIDTKKRNEYAGTETLFRELTGTFIVCLSSGIIAKGISHMYNNFVSPETKINPNTWVTNDSFNLLKHSWDKSDNNVKKYVSNILTNASGVDGNKTSTWKEINWNGIEWFDNPNWKNFKWQDSKFENIQNDLKNEAQITRTLSNLIEGKNTNKKDAKQVLDIIDGRITNALKVGKSINVNMDGKTLNSSLKNVIRDTYEMGKGIFANKSINLELALIKLQKMNKVKTVGALSVASGIGLTNQYINRKITEKRTGSDSFVGEIDYKKSFGNKNGEKTENKHRLFGLKLLASAGIIALAVGVMKIKNPKDFINKLEFTGPITSGNAIKTVYTATLVGRFMASKNRTELRESATRDYLGFLNWLVLGEFAAKGVAMILDKKVKNLFNINKQGKGLKHWLNDVSLKSHAEIASKGGEFAKKNIWKLNVAHASGLLYSTLALGFLIPLLNILITKNKYKNGQRQAKH